MLKVTTKAGTMHRMKELTTRGAGIFQSMLISDDGITGFPLSCIEKIESVLEEATVNDDTDKQIVIALLRGIPDPEEALDACKEVLQFLNEPIDPYNGRYR